MVEHIVSEQQETEVVHVYGFVPVDIYPVLVRGREGGGVRGREGGGVGGREGGGV